MSFYEDRKSIRTAFGDELAAHLKHHKRVKKVANNTFLYTDDSGTQHLRLHRTDILSRTPDGKVTVNDGGYRTITTKARMNSFLRKFGIPASISASNGVWWVHYQGATLPYWSGMCLPDDLGTPNKEAHHREIIERHESLQLAKGIARTRNEVTDTIFLNAMQWAGYKPNQLPHLDRVHKRTTNIVKRYLNTKKGLVP